MAAPDDTIRVLHVDGATDGAERAAAALERADDRLTVQTATRASEGLAVLTESDVDGVVSGYELPGQSGVEFLEAVRETFPDLPFILFADEGSEAVAAEAISAGVTDYVRKRDGTDQYAALADRIAHAVDAGRTERADVERPRREGDLDRFRRAMDEAPVGIIITDPDEEDNPIIYANRRFRELTGYAEGEILGRNCRFLQGEGTDPETVAMMREAIDREEQVSVELRNYRADGTEFWNRVSIAPVRDEAGSVVNYVGFQRDVTDRIERERELERQREQFQFVEEVADIGYWELDLTPPEPEPADSRGVYDIYELPPDEPIDVEQGLEFYHPEDRPKIERAVERAIDEGEPYELELRLTTASGTERWVHTVGEPVEREGEVVAVRGTIQDITERKRQEQALAAQNERLEQFANVISHDLRNPLNVAQGRIELARAEGDSDHLADAADAVDRSLELIDDLLSLAREGERASEVEPVDLRAVCERCRQTIGTTDTTLDIRADRRIRADSGRLQQLLENLVRNAVEHGGDDPTVTVGDLPDGFYVADDGPGIPADERDRVFEAGYSTGDGGTGLGLDIVANIAEAHGWGITLTESERGGTRFEITGVEMVDG